MKILLIEDNRLFGEFIGAHIEGVTAVGTLMDAMEVLAYERFDLLLVDLGLPDSQGWNTLKAFSHVRCPKIVITVTEKHLTEAASMGYVDYITKSDPDAVVKRIKFNLDKLAKKRVRFAPDVFAAIQRHLAPVESNEWIVAH